MSDKVQDSGDIFTCLDAALAERGSADPAKSYTASLYAGGTRAITAKIAEEASEVIEAATRADGQSIGSEDSSENNARLIHEVADLWFHCMVLLQSRGLDVRAVQQELARRFGVSGIEEKAARAK